MRFKAGVFALLLAALVGDGAVSAGHKRGNEVELELDARPEGITEGPGSTLFVSQILSGSVVAFDARNGKYLGEVVPEQDGGRQAWGLWYYKHAIFVAGGGEPFGGGRSEVYVYDAYTGKSLATCTPEFTGGEFGIFINDVVVRNGKAYITDSLSNKLMVMDAEAALHGKCVVSSLDLPDVFTPLDADDFGANGVVAFADGLLVADEVAGSVWYVSLYDDSKHRQIIADGDAPGADGLVVCDDKLYVTLNSEDKIAVYSLRGGWTWYGWPVSAHFLGDITSDLYATPATSAIYKGYIYSTNSRFFTLENIEDIPEGGDNAIGVRIPRHLRCNPRPYGGKGGKGGKGGHKKGKKG